MAGLFQKPAGGKSALTNFQRRGLADAQFSTIKDSLRKKNKEKAVSENVVMEIYVDSTRRLAVNLAGGGGGDLKQLMAEHSLGVKEDTSNSGISLDVVYLKQAEHLMRSDNYKTAIKYTHKALEINPEMTSAMSLLADIYLKTNDWANATHAADIVLERGKSHNKARLVKAEALFNVCQFEHAMVHFHRGMAASRDREQKQTFRLGVQKCKKIIYDCVPPKKEIFEGNGMEVLFKMLRAIHEGRDVSQIDKEANLIDGKKKAPVSLTSMMNMAKTKSKMAKDARENMQIKEEEQLTKRTKTILDKEHAITEQQKIKENRAMETLKAKKMPGGFGSKPSGFGKKKLNLKKITGASKGALAAVEIHNTFYKAEEERNKKKNKVKVDRLKKDKQYLNSLQRNLSKRTDIPEDPIHMQVLLEAEDVLDFLKQRDMFWDQLQSNISKS